MAPHTNALDIADGDMDVDVLVELGYDLVDAILRRRPLKEIKEKVAGGARVWYQDDARTSLHAAAYVENAELVRYLIEEGARWNAGECYPCSHLRKAPAH